MSYSVYTTEGFILASALSGEANKLYTLYTRDFGLVRASAQGVRHLKSKLRYSLDDYGHAAFSLVKGREIWRITGAMPVGDSSSSSALPMRARVLSLVRRLVQGEERNDILYGALEDLFTSDSSVESEARAVARVLGALGYIDVASTEGLSLKDLTQAVNKALKETHL